MKVCFPYNQNESFMNQWDYVLSNFQPEKVWIVGDRKAAFLSNPLKKAEFISDFSELPDVKKVVMAPRLGRYVQGDIDLNCYDHPKDAVYIFGSDSRNLEFDFDEDVDRVFIKTDTPDEMYSFVSYAVVCWDRRLRLGDC